MIEKEKDFPVLSVAKKVLKKFCFFGEKAKTGVFLRM